MADQQNKSQENSTENKQEFESDTQKLTNLHMSDENHVITDQEMQNIRVGMTPGPDAPTQEAIEDGEDRIADKEADKEDDTIPGAQKSTPWDVIGP